MWIQIVTVKLRKRKREVLRSRLLQNHRLKTHRLQTHRKMQIVAKFVWMLL